MGEDPEAVHREVADRLARVISGHPDGSGPFRVAVSGGSTPKGLYERLGSGDRAGRLPWRKVHLFFADERCVPPDHPDSNYRLVRSTLIDRLPRPPARVFRIECEKGEPEEVAVRYETVIHADLGAGEAREGLDLALLGVGIDGHTASLFPGAPSPGRDWQLAIAADPPEGAKHRRVTLSLPFLRRSRAIWLVVTGRAKAAIVARIHGEGGGDLPARQVAVRPDRVTWFLDREAAALMEFES